MGRFRVAHGHPASSPGFWRWRSHQNHTVEMYPETRAWTDRSHEVRRLATKNVCFDLIAGEAGRDVGEGIRRLHSSLAKMEPAGMRTSGSAG